MPVETVVPRLQTILAGITGVTKAYDRLPGTLNAADLPVFLIVPGEATQTMKTAKGWMEEERVYNLLLYVKPLRLDSFNRPMNDVRPFFRRVQEKFVGSWQFGSLESVMFAHLESDSGVVPLVYGRAEYAGIEFRIRVKESYSATVVA